MLSKHNLVAGFYFAKQADDPRRFLVSVTGVAPFLSVHHVGADRMSLMVSPEKLEFLEQVGAPIQESQPTVEQLATINSKVVLVENPRKMRGY